MAKGDAPVLEAPADINTVSLERTELDSASLILLRLAALIASVSRVRRRTRHRDHLSSLRSRLFSRHA
jgi:hypothetical protein